MKKPLNNNQIPVALEEIALVLSAQDNVTVARKNISRGTKVKYAGKIIEIQNDIAVGQRFSLQQINRGVLLKQYGFPFAISNDIQAGSLICKNNIKNYRMPFAKLAKAKIPFQKPAFPLAKIWQNKYGQSTFPGYVRADGAVGTRNYYLIVPTSLCASDLALKIAGEYKQILKDKYPNLDGVIAAAHTEGCGCNDGGIIDRLMLTLKNTVRHPNVAGALILDLGCEKTNLKVVSQYFADTAKFNKPLDFLSIQEAGGTRKTIEAGKKIIDQRLPELNRISRQPALLNKLIIGTECGASDSFSGITANPLIGQVADMVISLGGSALLSETTEMVGAEINLLQRMRSAEVKRKFLKGVKYYIDLAGKLGVSLEGNLVQGNEKGGLLNLTIKSLGAILKGGSSEIVDFLDYAEKIRKPGLSLMNGPGNDLESMSGIVASGANIILFSTGAGTTEGNLLVPVIKIPTRTEIFNKLSEDMDFNAGRLISENISLAELSEQLLSYVIEVCSGKKTWSEIWEKHSFQIWTAGKLSL